MRPNDLFFHTTARGAPVCIIQNEEKLSIPDLTLRETANFDASYSSGWKYGWGNSDVYYVYPEQVSKTPKAGEYLTKGSFYITGKKNLISHPFLEVAIGVLLEPVGEYDHLHEEEENESENVTTEKLETEEVSIHKNDIGNDQESFIIETSNNEDNEEELLKNTLENTEEEKIIIEESSTDGVELKEHNDNISEDANIQYYPKIISGPISAIKKQTSNLIIIKPTKSRTSTSDLAKKIMKRLESQAKEEEKKWVKLISVNDVIRVIPPGDSEIVLK